MELYQLRSFSTVAGLGHVTRAAEKLHISQPALSAQLKALEDELGVHLFERTSSGMQLTAAGERLLAHAERTLDAARDLQAEARAMSGRVAGHLRVGTVSDPDFIRVGELLARVVERYPLLKLELHHEVSGAAFEAVRDGSLDASFYFGELDHSEVAALKLREVVYRVAAPAAMCERIQRADWSDIAAEPWVLTPSISTHNRLVRTLFEEHGLAPAKLVEADQESVIKSLVVSGVGLSLLREEVAHKLERAGEVCIWPHAKLRTTLSFIYRLEHAQEPSITVLLQLLREVWNLQDGGAAVRVRRAIAG